MISCKRMMTSGSPRARSATAATAWSPRRLVLLAGAVLLMAATGQAEEPPTTAAARIPCVVDVTAPDLAGRLDPVDIRRAEFRAARVVQRAMRASPDRLITLRVENAPFSFERLDAGRQERLLASYGDEASATYEREMARFLDRVLDLASDPMPDVPLSVLGLPVEPRGSGATTVTETNRRYASVLDSLTAFVPERSFVLSGGAAGTALLRRSLPQAERLRGDRPIVFQSNGAWHSTATVGTALLTNGQTPVASPPPRRPNRPRIAANDGAHGDGAGTMNPGPGEMPLPMANPNFGNGGESDGDGGAEGDGGDAGQDGERAYYWVGKGSEEESADLSHAPVIEDRVVIFYGRDLGLYPKIWEGEPVNGGVPQRADFPGHLAKVAEDVVAAIPDPGWDGYAVIDYEAWNLVWERTRPEYQEYSLELTQQAYPSLPEDEIEAITIAEYELKAREFMEKTILLCQQLRPHAKWGFFPYGRPWHAQYPQLNWLWEVSDAFYPELYAWTYSVPDDGPPPGEFQEYAQYYRDRFKWTKEFLDSAMGDNPRPVFAFIWRNYMGPFDSPYRGQEVNELDLETMVRQAWEEGFDGVMIWENCNESEDVEAFNEFFENRMAPIINDVLENSQQPAENGQ